jgi:hypothetical protein
LNIEVLYDEHRNEAALSLNGTQFFFEIGLSKEDLLEIKDRIEHVLKEIKRVEGME